jgi:hypothetical protein
MPAGDPAAKSFACQLDVDRWRPWFAEWKYLRTIAFICEDIWWRRSSDITASQACETAEEVVRQWLVDSSLHRFEMWSGADRIQLSPQFRVAYAQFHKFHESEPPRHRYLFRRDETAADWTLSRLAEPLCSSIFQFREDICAEGCWICQLVKEEEDDLGPMISYWDRVRELDWCYRKMALKPWSRLDVDRTYSLVI